MIDNVIKLARKEIVSMSAYRSAKSEGLQGNIFLNANENSFCDKKYSRYPNQQPNKLIDLLTKIYGVNQKQLLVTRGSDEGIDLILRLFCYAGLDKILICPPTYGMYKISATIQGVETIEVPLIKKNQFTLDINAVLQACDQNIKLIFLCSPNNPTGNLLSKEDILYLCRALEKKSVVVVDEAYIEFADDEGLIGYINQLPNLVILRTLSKAYGLAGVRCGVTIANTSIVELLTKIIAPYPIPGPIEEIIYHQLDIKNTRKIINTIQEEKEKLTHFFNSLPFVKKVWDSQTNYILIETTDADKIMNLCLKHGIVLRNRSDDYGLNNCIRITVGTPRENALLKEVLGHV